MKKIFQFLRESYNELRIVSWPTREQAIHYTILVIFISVFVALVLGLLDIVFGEFIKSLFFKI